MKIQCYDKLGWPVELFINRPVTNFIRRVLHTRGLCISLGTAPPPRRYADRGPVTGGQASKAAPRLPADTHLRKP